VAVGHKHPNRCGFLGPAPGPGRRAAVRVQLLPIGPSGRIGDVGRFTLMLAVE